MEEERKTKQRILVTGGAGYVGSTLIADALAEGYRVRCLDSLIYGPRSMDGFIKHPHFEFIKGDIRDESTVEKSLADIDAVVHLAAIVGDLPCRAAPKSAVEINFKGTQLLAQKAKQLGVERFIFNSTCSNYGIMDSEKAADESHELNPVSLYAETKIDCEQFLNSISDEHFSVTSLRFATGFGVSYRTRFDLLVNSLAYEAWANGEIIVFAADTWRPYIHVSDMSLIIKRILEAPSEKIRGQIFNAGTNSQNYTKRDIIKILQNSLTGLKTRFIDTTHDKRNYKVNFDKIERIIGFRPSKNVDYGFKELLNYFEQGILTKDDFEINRLETLEKFFTEKENHLKDKI